MGGKMIFLNLPVEDLARSKRFYEAIGWSINKDFTDENAACVIVEDNICLMLLSKDFYATFTKRPIADTLAASGALYALAMESREAVDALTEAAVEAGGTEEVNEQKRAQEAEVGMHGRAFQDLDGHQWEPFFMDYSGA
jgi:predicted lactoylglutathione lyase